MKAEYKNTYQINYTEVDQNLKLRLIEAIIFHQNMATEYFESFESDNVVLKEQNNAAWVVSKTKVHFNKYPTWGDKIYGRSYTTKVKPIRVEMETIFRNAEGELLFCTKQESCPIDLGTRKIRKIDTVNYPSDMETEKNIIQEPFLKLNEKFSENDFVYEQKVFSSDIDFSRHTNNASYVRYIMNTVSCEFLDNNQITDFEIHYINESKEGQILKIYKKEEQNVMEFLIKEGEREIIRASFNYDMK